MTRQLNGALGISIDRNPRTGIRPWGSSSHDLALLENAHILSNNFLISLLLAPSPETIHGADGN